MKKLYIHVDTRRMFSEVDFIEIERSHDRHPASGEPVAA